MQLEVHHKNGLNGTHSSSRRKQVVITATSSWAQSVAQLLSVINRMLHFSHHYAPLAVEPAPNCFRHEELLNSPVTWHRCRSLAAIMNLSFPSSSLSLCWQHTRWRQKSLSSGEKWLPIILLIIYEHRHVKYASIFFSLFSLFSLLLSSVSLCWRWGFDKPSPSASISGQNRCCC